MFVMWDGWWTQGLCWDFYRIGEEQGWELGMITYRNSYFDFTNWFDYSMRINQTTQYFYWEINFIQIINNSQSPLHGYI